MSLMMLAAAKGSEINLSCEGDDEIEAMQQISQLFAERFGEHE